MAVTVSIGLAAWEDADREPGAPAPFPPRRYPEPLLVDGIDVDGHVLWGMTLRLLDALLPRLLAGEWDL